MGYGMMEEKHFEVVGRSADYGIDGIVYYDKVRIDSIDVQAKKWNENKVQSKDIRDIIGLRSYPVQNSDNGVRGCRIAVNKASTTCPGIDKLLWKESVSRCFE